MNHTPTVHTPTALNISNPAIHSSTAQLVHIARELAAATAKVNSLRADMANTTGTVLISIEQDARRWAAHARALLDQLVGTHQTLAQVEAAYLMKAQAGGMKAQSGGLLDRIKAHSTVAKVKRWAGYGGLLPVRYYIDLHGCPSATPFKLWLDDNTLQLHQKGDANTLPSSILSLWWDFLDAFANDFAPGGIESPKPEDTQ